jgi:hypothetical protein
MAHKPLLVHTLSTSSVALSVRTWCGANGVALVEAETEEEEEEGAVGDVGSAVHPEDWKYLWVGTNSAAAPSAPLVSDELRVRWLDRCEHEQKGSWCVGIGGELRLGIGLIEEDHIGVGMSCVRAMSVEHVQLADWRKHALPQFPASHGTQCLFQACIANVSVAHIEAV